MSLNSKLIEEIKMICNSHSMVEKVYLFGSRARKDNSQRSDIDLAIKVTGISPR